MAKQLLKERFQELAGIRPLYELEKENPLLTFLQKNKGEVEKAIGHRLTDFDIERIIGVPGDEGDISSTDEKGHTGYAFRHVKDIDDSFVGQEGEPSKPITIAGAWINYISYNI